MTTPQLAKYIHGITRWIMAQPRKCLLDDYNAVFRYVAAANFYGKMSVAFDPPGGSVTRQIEAVVFHWPENLETLEAKSENGHQIFEFNYTHKGNVLFIGDCIGKREAISRLYKGMIQKYPHLTRVPFYTFRKGKLVKMNPELLNRYMKVEVDHGKFRA